VARVNWKRIIIRIVYWVAVVAVSVALVLALVLLFESLDDSSVDEGAQQESGEAALPYLPT
jgi:hypothetical protein